MPVLSTFQRLCLSFWPFFTLPEPARLLAAHGEAMPDGVGAALGFDRLVMLAAGAESIDAVRCFSSTDA
jgi:elongation factor P--beta-lysine ligase